MKMDDMWSICAVKIKVRVSLDLLCFFKAEFFRKIDHSHLLTYSKKKTRCFPIQIYPMSATRSLH